MQPAHVAAVMLVAVASPSTGAITDSFTSASALPAVLTEPNGARSMPNGSPVAVVVDRVLGDRVVLRDRRSRVDRLDAVGLDLHASGVVRDLVPGTDRDARGARLDVDAAELFGPGVPFAVTPILLCAITESCTPLSTSSRRGGRSTITLSTTVL